MAKRSLSSIADAMAPVVVVLIALVAIGAWALYQFGPSPSGAPTATPAQNALVPQVAAQISLDAPQSLPRKVTAGEIVSFSFTVKNPGAASATYPYKVYVKWQGGTQDVIDLNTLTLNAGQSMDIPESLKFETVTNAEVYIEFQDPTATMHFALPRLQ